MKSLIIEGGGFRTGFTSGVLDAMIIGKHNPFQSYYGISGGAVSLSYFLSNQYRTCYTALQYLVGHPSFTDFRRAFQSKGYMDIDFLKEVSSEKFPFKIETALANCSNRSIQIVVTNKLSGKAEYLSPQNNNWIDLIVASCSLPFATKGEHILKDNIYFDGGWGDALPVIEAYNQGAKEITIVRTWISGVKTSQSWIDYFGSIYYRSNPVVSEIFNSSFKKYNDAIDFIMNPPSDLKIIEISPEQELYSGTYTYSKTSVENDYRYGLDKGIQYLSKL